MWDQIPNLFWVYVYSRMYYKCRKSRIEPDVSFVSSTESNEVLNVQETQYVHSPFVEQGIGHLVYCLYLKSLKELFNIEQ